jgi:hypothetical protein
MARAIEKMRNVERDAPEARSFTAEQSQQHFNSALRSYHLSEMASDADEDLDFGPPESAPHRLASSSPVEADIPAAHAMRDPTSLESEDLAEALSRLQDVLKRQPRAYLRTVETWTRARITEELTLGARGLDERHRPLLERVARILRGLMHERD